MASFSSLIAVLADTTPQELFKVKPLSRVRVKKVMVFNSDTASHRVQLGYSPVKPDGTIDTTSFTQLLPDIVAPPGQTVILEVPPATVSSTDKSLNALTARIEVATTAPVLVVAELEEA